jgi:tetratricopeptide (TPR) repeat protein
VIAASEGNPLFLEEMVALAQERGTVEIPPTIQALLTARLEHLSLDEQELLERGSIEGEVFHRLAVRALADERLATELELRLAALVRKELIRPHPATLKGDEAFRFRHLLIRDAAYEALPKATRADLHERFADWLEDVATDLVEFDEICGWHLEQAVHYQHELGRAIDPIVAKRAAEHLYSAGRKAAMRSDHQAARNLLERALDLAPESDTVHARTAVQLAEEDMTLGDMTRVDSLLSAAEVAPEVASYASVIRLQWLQHARPSEAAVIIEAELPRLIARFEAAGDELGLANANFVAMMSFWQQAQAARAGRRLKVAAEHARRAGDEGLRSRALAVYTAALVYGPAPVTEMIAELDELEGEGEGEGPYLESFVAAARTEVALLEGRLDDARQWAHRAIDVCGRLSTHMEAFGWDQLAFVELASGDLEAALSAFERADARHAEAGMDGFRCTVLARIAEVQVARGELEAALEALELSEQLAGRDDVINDAITRRVHAQIALAEGDIERAEEWARSAVQRAFKSDFPVERGAAKLDLAKALASANRRKEAAAEARDALAIYDAKGDRPGMAAAQALLDELG